MKFGADVPPLRTLPLRYFDVAQRRLDGTLC